MDIKISTDDLMSVKDSAIALKVQPVTIYRWIEQGKIRAITLGKSTFTVKAEIERLKTK